MRKGANKMSTTQPIKNWEQLERFRNYYKKIEYSPRNYALIVLGLNSALRISDILALHWKDVYQFDKKEYKTHLCVVEKKTGKQNTISLNHSAREALEMYRKELTEINADAFLFTSQKRDSECLSRSQAFRAVKKAAAACGLENHISCHSLRKTFGYFAWKNGVPPALLMKIYNHSSYEMTKRYLCIDQYEKDEVYEKILL
jgi:integrase